MHNCPAVSTTTSHPFRPANSTTIPTTHNNSTMMYGGHGNIKREDKGKRGLESQH
jgi:hypothetical protein